ncbi:MAG: hypothetical protein EB027_06520, partial [Actinobacteria bacterium]|nr:hypothetical protein [Actinomycetota bacterium]
MELVRTGRRWYDHRPIHPATSGAVFCWGRNSSGQFGDGTTTSRLVPGLTGGGMAFTSLVAGGGHVCGLTSVGTAYCWGGNPNGQIGDGTVDQRTTPVAVDVSAVVIPTPTPTASPTPGPAVFTTLSGGGQHTCGLTASGRAYCWGDNS